MKNHELVEVKQIRGIDDLFMGVKLFPKPDANEYGNNVYQIVGIGSNDKGKIRYKIKNIENKRMTSFELDKRQIIELFEFYVRG
jgi:hypothetical protein